MHLSAVGMAEPLFVPIDLQRQMHPAVAPRIPQLVRCYGYRCEAARGLRVKEAESGPYLARHESAAADIVQLQHQLQVWRSLRRGATERNVIDHYGEFSL